MAATFSPSRPRAAPTSCKSSSGSPTASFAPSSERSKYWSEASRALALAVSAPGFPSLLRSGAAAGRAAAALVLPAFVLLVHRPPRALFRFLLGNAALLIALLNMVGLALLLGRIRTTGHHSPPSFVSLPWKRFELPTGSCCIAT